MFWKQENTYSYQPRVFLTLKYEPCCFVDTHVFQASDVEKTVVIPGYSSFLITEVTGGLTALADATMPDRVPVGSPLPSRQWFLYDFGTTTGRKWRVVVDRCRYTIQQLDDLPIHAIKYLDLGSGQNFSFRVSPVNVGKTFEILRVPILIYELSKQPI